MSEMEPVYNGRLELLLAFRKHLPVDEQVVLDELVQRISPRFNASAAASRFQPFERMLLSIIVEQEMEMRRLRTSPGHDVVTVDNDAKFEPTIVADLMGIADVEGLSLAICKAVERAPRQLTLIAGDDGQ